MKPRIPNQRKANLEHKKRTERYAHLIQQIYDRVAEEAARKASLAGYDPSKPFSFADFPMTQREILKLQAQLISEVKAVIMSGTSAEWKESNLVQDLVAKKVLTAYTGTNKHGDEFTRYFQTNPDALKAFQERKDEGMNLSTRVWNLSEQYKTELEEAITAAIAPGTSAMELAAEVKKYLKEPDKRFRRIKEKMEDGTIKWHLSKNAKAYHPGQGVYRSSARNAQRLARTEINMAYRTAEQERWKQFDFVVGYEVKTTQNGHHVEDICDQLAGKYPKDFVFKGWHVQCLCYCLPILKTEEEFWDLDEDKPSVNSITEVPDNFKEWIRENSDRIEKATEKGTLPYFIKDNREMVTEILENSETLGNNDSKPAEEKTYPTPPHVEKYTSYHDGRILASPKHGADELEANLKLGNTLYEAIGETVYLLPNINPKGKDAHLRSEYLPKGAKEGKNPDYLCAGRFWDGKECSFANTEKEWKCLKKTLENHFKKAKEQADNFIIQVPDWFEEEMLTAITRNYLNVSKKDRWIIICKENGKYWLFKNTTG